MDANRTAVRIFDLIDRNSIGQAEGALEAALEKYPNHDGLRAAEAMVLFRSGKRDLAKEKAEALSKHDVTDPKAVNALVHVLQQSCSWEALAVTYERVKHLQNEKEVLENLVQTYVRMGAYGKAQQTATILNRTYPNPKYQVWVLQACLGQVPAGSTDCLQLKIATKLLSTSILTDTGITTPSTVRTYVDVLAQQGLYAQAVDFLCSMRGSRIGLLETRLEVLAGLLRSQGRTRCANAVALFHWRLLPDNWTPFSIYMDTLDSATGDADATGVLKLESEDAALTATVDCSNASRTLEEALAVARELQAAEQRDRPSKMQRGPFMAELALLQRVVAHNGAAGPASASIDTALVAYAQKFYRKPCCFLDLSTFLSAKAAEAIYEWSLEEGSDAAATDNTSALLAMHARKLLGLRCHVASWGTTRETQPNPAVMKALMESCVSAYEEALPLSAQLAWSEEGHCDGYINVVLNIALHAYVGQGMDLMWVVEGLALQQKISRRTSNPSWLLFSVCLANLLGLTDLAALHQLAFKSVQHDTMTHAGYWPLLTGLALKDVNVWEGLASDYYLTVERDCSLLRAKVFTFTSWPAMQDVQEFERRQANSLVRWLSAPHLCASLVVECQTQRNIATLLESRVLALWNSLQQLEDGEANGTLVDNTDWSVIKSLVLGDIHSEKVTELTRALLPAASLAARVRRGRQLLHSLFLLHDVSALEQHRQALANAPKPRKAKKNAATASEPSIPPSTLYCPKIVEQLKAKGKTGELDCLPTIAPLAAVLMPYIESAEHPAVSYTDSLAKALQSLLEGPTGSSSEAFEQFLYPEAFLLAALVRAGTSARLPVQRWASDLHDALTSAAAKYRPGEVAWSAACVAVLPEGGFAHTLQAEKEKRINEYLADLLVDLAATTRCK